MNRPAVTVVTPSYNQGDFVRATIESVLSQDYPDLEYIVMDGGSTDQTAAIAAEYASRLTWVSEKDRGQSHAINKGFVRARGKIVAWLNSDDLFVPGAVSRAVAAFADTPNVGAVYGDGYLMDRDGARMRRFPETQPFNLWRLVYLSDYVLQPSTFFRRAAVEEVGWLDESLHYTMDWDLLIRLGKRFGLRYLPEYLSIFRLYPETKTSSGGGRRIEEIRQVLERQTGLKRAPGYWTYGLDTVQQKVRNRLVNRSPRWLQMPARLVNLTVYLPTAVAIMLILRHAQGIYPDGWASDRVRWMLPEGRGDVLIRGIVPDDRGREMTLTASVAGRAVGVWSLRPGHFEVRFPAPELDGPLSFELRASTYRRPALREFSLRRVSFFLESADWASARVRPSDPVA